MHRRSSYRGSALAKIGKKQPNLNLLVSERTK
jgi:hypothetical protein